MTEETLHSSLVGGSTAARRIACPASYQLENKLPKSLEKQSSVFADEGTALHECMAFILRENLVASELEEVILGKEFAGFVLTRELLDDAIYPCVAFIDTLMDELEGEGDLELLVESRVEMPGIPGAFGTADVIARTAKRSIGIDWKFGVGVPVRAEYDGVPNAQLCFYNRAGIHTFPHMYGQVAGLPTGDWPVDMYIVQPRVHDGDKVSHVRVTTGQLEEFRLKLIAAVDEARGDNPRMARGPHCRFAPSKVICPLHTGPAISLAKMEKMVKSRKTRTAVSKDVDWGAMYGELLDLSEIAEELVREIRAQAHTYMGDGNAVHGWKLVEKRATEKYVDDGAVKAAKAAEALGVPHTDVFEPAAIKSPAQLRDTLAPLMSGKTQADKKASAAAVIGQFTSKVSSGTTIARDSDDRNTVRPTASQLASLSNKLAALAPPAKKLSGE